MSQSGVVSWSRTAASNATADSNVNWAEGMAPSQVNDSARAMMASVAQERDDQGGHNTATGGPTTYAYSSLQTFSSLTILDGKKLTMFFATANAANPTLNVDGLGALPITLDASNAIPVGFIAAGTTHTLTYDNGSGTFYIHSVSIVSFLPPGVINAYAGSSAPTGWLMCDGTGYLRATYVALFAAIGTTYGSSDGSGFSVPDLRGRVPAGKEASASRLTAAVSGVDGGTLGASGGHQALMSHTHSAVSSDSGHTHTYSIVQGSGSGISGGSGDSLTTTNTGSGQANITTTVSSAGAGTAQNVQPTLIVNYIIKI